jgi:hypothetical protein
MMRRNIGWSIGFMKSLLQKISFDIHDPAYEKAKQRVMG